MAQNSFLSFVSQLKFHQVTHFVCLQKHVDNTKLLMKFISQLVEKSKGGKKCCTERIKPDQ